MGDHKEIEIQCSVFRMLVRHLRSADWDTGQCSSILSQSSFWDGAEASGWDEQDLMGFIT